MRRQRGFTLLELLVVVALLATVAGVALVATVGTETKARGDLALAELGVLRRAVLAFEQDMGEPPRFVAELLQSPDPAAPEGGWWWRTAPADQVPATLHAYDPAIRRGWNGPYVERELTSSPGRATVETRIDASGTSETITSDSASGEDLAILLAPGQRITAATVTSDYQLDASDTDSLVARILGTQSEPRTDSVELRLGVQP